MSDSDKQIAKMRSAGLICYIKDEISVVFNRLMELFKHEDRLWLKLNSSLFGFSSDLFLCFTYISPATSTSTYARGNIWQLLNTEVAQFSMHGNILLMNLYRVVSGQVFCQIITNMI